MNKKKHHLSYAKWGYIFILPFFVTFFIFSLIPLVDTVRYSFFEYYRSGIKEIGPTFIGLENYAELLKSDMVSYAGNTLILWLIGFVPQIVIALLLANWFTDVRLTAANSSSRSSSICPTSSWPLPSPCSSSRCSPPMGPSILSSCPSG